MVPIETEIAGIFGPHYNQNCKHNRSPLYFFKTRTNLVFSFLRFGSITIKCPGLLHVSSTALNLLENSTCLQSHVCQGLFLFLSSVYIVSLFKNWDGPYLYSAGHSVLTKLVPNQTVMSVRPISGWLKVGLPIKMRTIKPPMGKWYKYCFNFKTDFWLMTKLILFLLIKTITIKPCFN